MPRDLLGIFDFGDPDGQISDEYESRERSQILEIFKKWAELVGIYTQCELTYEKDKLVAFSALVKTFQTKYNLKGRYLAGIWESMLHTGLLWSQAKKGKRSTIYRAPSWSWASTDGLIVPSFLINMEDYQELATIIDISVTTKSHEPFGMVTDGYLIMDACVAEGIELNDTLLLWDTEEERKKDDHASVFYVHLVFNPWRFYGLMLESVTQPNSAREKHSKNLRVFRRVGTFTWWRRNDSPMRRLRYKDKVDEHGDPVLDRNGIARKELLWPDPNYPMETIKII